MTNMPSDKSSILSAIIRAVEQACHEIEVQDLGKGRGATRTRLINFDPDYFLQALKEETEKE